jgi:general secretion pathway protein A
MSETKGYIQHRLTIAGASSTTFFNTDALDEIFNFSQGIPRLINIICDKALLAGYVTGKNFIEKVIIKRCVKELEGNYK